MIRPNRRQETFSPSEDYLFTTSSIFNQPQAVESWSQSVSLGEESFPTPPDSISECTASDFFDMSNPTWTQGSLPEEWSTVPTEDNSTLSQAWPSEGIPVTSQGLQALDTAALLNVSQGSVVTGASPVLSHQSQSSYTLPSVSESDPMFLPATAAGCSFNADPSWSQGPYVYNPSDVSSPVSGQSDLLAFGHGGMDATCNGPYAPAFYPRSQPAMILTQGGQVPYQRRAVSYPQAVSMRPLLPRTSSTTSSHLQPAYGSRRSSRPYIQASRSSRSVLSSVSSSYDRVLYPVEGPATPVSMTSQGLAAYQLDQGTLYPVSGAVTQPLMVHAGQPAIAVSYAPNSASLDQGPYFLAGPEDHVSSPGSLSYASGFDGLYPMPTPNTLDVMWSQAGQGAITDSAGSKDHKQSAPAEREEAKYRTDPHYEAGPQPDGKYHCPWEKEGCGHAPVELKCNYAKYIDSHLRPFVCKVETCGNQHFSSTACLLRHEREAHGMHGHGERPHLCFYEGCERSQAGNGFPRKYNLMDHMKRVHQYEDTQGHFQTKSVAGRKRKDTPSESAKQGGEPKRTASQSAKTKQETPTPTAFHQQPAQYGQVQAALSAQYCIPHGWPGQQPMESHRRESARKG